MITAQNVDPATFIYAVNLSTPQTGEEFAPLKEWCETSPHQVMVSTAYGWCLDCYKPGGINGMNRDGYLFMFWFDNRDAAHEFSDEMSKYSFGSINGDLKRGAAVIEDCGPGAPDARYRVMEAMYAGQPWFEERYRKKEES